MGSSGVSIGDELADVAVEDEAENFMLFRGRKRPSGPLGGRILDDSGWLEIDIGVDIGFSGCVLGLCGWGVFTTCVLTLAFTCGV